MEYIRAMDAMDFVKSLADNSVHLALTDPPYYGVVQENWDNQWESEDHFCHWLTDIFLAALPKLTDDGSLVFFGGMGKQGSHPLFKIVPMLEAGGYHFRQWITWKKKRAYGKEYDYLYTREEILWFSKSPERTQVRFNKPYLEEKRGYAGFNKKHPAKSEFKRVTNVWTDIDPVIEITELFRTERECQKPEKLMRRLVSTHSHEGDLIVDPFCGWGSTGVSAVSLGRKFLGSEAIVEDAVKANQRVFEAIPKIEGTVLDLLT